MLQALVFDFDGLIVDTESAIFAAWQELYARFDCRLTQEDWLHNIGTADESFDPLAQLKQRAGLKPTHNLEPELTWRWEREAELVAQQPVLPGVIELLEEARRAGLKIGLASSSSCNWVTGHLQRLGLLAYFQAIVASDDVAQTKPHPALYRAAVARLHTPPAQAVALEDSLHGLIAAQQAGLRCVVAPNPLTKASPFHQADWLVDSLAQVTLHDLQTRFGSGAD